MKAWVTGNPFETKVSNNFKQGHDSHVCDAHYCIPR